MKTTKMIVGLLACAALLGSAACSTDTSDPTEAPQITGPANPEGVTELELRFPGGEPATPVFTNGEKSITSVTLESGQSLQIVPAKSLGTSATITAFTLYAADGGGKGALIGTWQPATGNGQPHPSLLITKKGPALTVTNVNGADVDYDFFFAVTAEIDGVVYDSDPELRVKKNTGN